jgi:hypothetical protein
MSAGPHREVGSVYSEDMWNDDAKRIAEDDSCIICIYRLLSTRDTADDSTWAECFVEQLNCNQIELLMIRVIHANVTFLMIQNTKRSLRGVMIQKI